jgi:hypothetical protein
MRGKPERSVPELTVVKTEIHFEGGAERMSEP